MRVHEIQKGIKRIQLEMSPIKGLPNIKLKCNVYAIETESGISLFDCGPGEAAADLKSALGAELVNQIFLTHGHTDHAGGGGYWLKEGARVFALEDELAMLRSGGPEKAPQSLRYSGFEPTGTVRPGERITLDEEFSFLVLPAPGHTSGSVCYYDEQRDILILGDLLFGPLWGHTATFLAEFITSQRQHEAKLRQQIESMESLVNDGVIKNTTLILPGHGPEYYICDKPGAVKRSSNLLRLCSRL